MVLARKNLKKRFYERKSESLREQNLIVYGCAAHYLNLVENDVSPRVILKQIVEVQRYFRNHHQPSGWLTEKNGVKPQLPNSTRWNSQNDCIDSFLKNYQIMHQICIEHKSVIEKEIIQIMNNAGLYMEAVHLQQQLRLVSSALDSFQKDGCCLGEVAHIWHKLLEADVLLPYKDAIQKRYGQCITPAHMVAYLAHPKYKGEKLTSAEEEIALDWLKSIDDGYTIPLMTLQILDNDYYPKSMFKKNVTEVLAPSKWWKIMAKKAEKSATPLNKEFCNFMAILNSLPASSASVERLFSTFGFVQNKVRNRLGNEKTEKLVKCHRLLKSKCDEDW